MTEKREKTDAQKEHEEKVFGKQEDLELTADEEELLNSKDVNAWALPGGKLAVNSGLLSYVNDPAELGSVIAHEIGHWKKGHITKRLVKTFFMVPVMFFVLALLLNYSPLFLAFGMSGPSYYGLLVLVMLISSSFTFFSAL